MRYAPTSSRYHDKNNVKGTLLLANEGINGTVAGTLKSIDDLLAYLKSNPRLIDIDYKESYHQEMPSYRSKVKLKKRYCYSEH